MRAKSKRQVLFVGMFGCGNLGNEASLSVVVQAVRQLEPDREMVVLCDGPAEVREMHGLTASRMQWMPARSLPLPGPVVKLMAKGVDAVRILRFVRRSRCVIVPGTGIFEALGVYPWGIPWVLFVVAAAGRLTRVPVAFIDVGAEPIDGRASRELMKWAIRLSRHTSFRDRYSWRSVAEMSVEVSRAEVVADLVFAEHPRKPVSTVTDHGPVVAIGVMSWFGTRDRPDDDEGAHARYVIKLVDFVTFLISSGYAVRLIIGDRVDTKTAEEILCAASAQLGSEKVEICLADNLERLTEIIDPAVVVVATRYHNIVTALQAGKPVISVGYARKNREILNDFGLGNYAQEIDDLDIELLKGQLESAITENAEIVDRIAAHRAVLHDSVVRQLGPLIDQLLGSEEKMLSVRRSVGSKPAPVTGRTGSK